MLFQGQEFGASAPFLYFADHEPELAELVREGAPSSSRSSRRLRDRRRARAARPRRTTGRRSSAASSTSASARRNAAAYDAPHATCSRFAARTRCSPRQRADWRRRRRARPGGACAALLRRRARTTGSSRQPRARARASAPCPSRCSRRPTGRAGRCSGRARTRRYGGSGTPPLGSPARPPRSRGVLHACSSLAPQENDHG